MSSLILPPTAAAAAQKAKLGATVHPRRCGNCWYSETEGVPNGQVRCEGLPPSPILVGMTQSPMGAEPQIILYRPNLPDGLKGCALWAQKDLPGLPTNGPAQ